MSVGHHRILGVSLHHRKQALLFGLAEGDALRELAAHERHIAALKVQAGTTARDREAQHNALKGRARKRAVYFTAMRRKYERAARFPWLAAEPDPPQPE